MSGFKPIGKKQAERMLRNLHDALASSRMGRARFEDICAEQLPPLEIKQTEVTAFIKERTRSYRESWIEYPLEQAITTLAEHLKGGRIPECGICSKAMEVCNCHETGRR